jgi:hypothetical protein
MLNVHPPEVTLPCCAEWVVDSTPNPLPPMMPHETRWRAIWTCDPLTCEHEHHVSDREAAQNG